MEPADLERRLGEALARLPQPKAPASLTPRVMAAIARQAGRPWYRREWLEWPRQWQIVSAALGALLVVGLASVDVGGTTAVPDARVGTTVLAMQILWRVVVEPVLPIVFGLAMVMCLTCVVLGLTLNYVALGRTWPR